MNKLQVVLLAMCLVCAHAFVRRDAPAAPQDGEIQNPLQDIGKQIEDFVNKDNIKKSLDNALNTVKQTLNSDELKKQLSGLLDSFNQAVQNLPGGPTTAAAPEKS